jgi:seryl-tRNA synthetase
MRIFKEFAEWFSKNDQKIIDYHLQKDRENLKRTLRELQEELQEMKALREKIDYLIKESERIVGKGEASLKKEEIKDYTTWLSEAEEKLTRIFKLESNTLSAADREVVQKELPRLRADRWSGKVELLSG